MGGPGSTASTLTLLVVDGGAKKTVRGTSSTSLVSTAILGKSKLTAKEGGKRKKVLDKVQK